MKVIKIQALLFDGFDELDVFGAFEALRMASFDVSFKSLHGEQMVTAAYGTRLECDGVFSLQDKPDLLLLPGGGWITRAPKGAWAEAEKGTILQTMRDIHAAGVIIASVCTGSLILGRAGLLTFRHATTNHDAIKELIDLGALYVASRVVDDKDIITAAGITSSIDLGLWIVERFASAQAAQTVSEKMEFERRGPVYRSSSSH